ncbi:MAG: NUDIX hydrolase [Acidobacteriota bacterium]
MPHRTDLLDLLARYGERFPGESDVVDRYRDFVERHENCFERSLEIGHVTGSAWLVDPAGERVLLTHHGKLGMWVQLGGHADGESDVRLVALAEAREESGLEVDLLSAELFDVDIHVIPRREKGGHVEPEHLHYDVRFALRARSEDFTVSEESLELAWVPVAEIAAMEVDASVRRMSDKWRAERWLEVPTA